MCSCQSILECCVMFSGVKLSMGSFVFFKDASFSESNIVKPGLHISGNDCKHIVANIFYNCYHCGIYKR